MPPRSSTRGARSSSAAAAAAPAFIVAGKTVKELGEWLKANDADAWSRLTGTTSDRYPWMKAVEDRLALMAKGEGAGTDEEDVQESKAPAVTAGKRKSRVSIGYESKPGPASPRVVEKITGTKRKGRSTDEDEEEEQSAGDAESETSEPSPRPTKKSRKSAPAPAKAAATSTARRTSKAAAPKKGRSSRASAAAAARESESDVSVESESHASEESMQDVKPPAAAVAGVRKSGAYATGGAAARQSPDTTGAAVPFAASTKRKSCVDPSLLSDIPVASIDEELPQAESGSEAAAENEDVHMRSASPESVSGPKFAVVSAPQPTQPNPFQAASPTAPAAAAAATAPTQSAVARARESLGRASSGGFVPASTMLPTPLIQARKSVSPHPATSDSSHVRASIGGFGAPATSGARYNPALAGLTTPFTPFTPASEASFTQFGSAERAREQHVPEEEQFAFSLPSYQPPTSRRASFGTPSHAGAREYDEQQVQEDHPQLRHRASYAPAQMEQKYATAATQVPSPIEVGAASPAADEAAQKQARMRRYSDHVSHIEEGVTPSSEADRSPTSPGAGAAAPSAKQPFGVRARRYLSSLGHFLLRTLLIGLMVLTVASFAFDNHLRRALFGAPASTTVFCPSNPNAPMPPLPPGQLTCTPCPAHGYCTPEGVLNCVDSGMYVREGDKCVLNDAAHQKALELKELAVAALEQRLGDFECGYLSPNARTDMSVAELRDAVEMAQGIDAQILPNGVLWTSAMDMLARESAPPVDRAITTARVLRLSPKVFEAVHPQLNLQCRLKMLLNQWLLHIMGASFLLSIITYVIFQVRLWSWRRAQVGPVCDAVRDRLSHLVEYTGAGGSAEHRPLAVAHLREEYLSGKLTGVRGDAKVWERAAKKIERDTRIERAKHTFGATLREAWTWTGPMPRDSY